MSENQPRIPPGTRAEIGTVNAILAAAISRGAGAKKPMNVFTTLARHKRLFFPWLLFAGRLMPRGTLRRRDTELLILRTAHNSGAEYEWQQHERIGKRAGLTERQIAELAKAQPDEKILDDRQVLLVSAADELHRDRVISQATWDRLRPILSDAELIELCMLVGHYEMLAMTLNSLQVQPER